MEQRTKRGGIRKRVNAAGKVSYQWSVVIDGQRVWGSEETQAAAKKARANAIAKGTFVAPTKITLSGYFQDEYLPSAKRGLKQTTVDTYLTLWAHVDPHLGNVKLSELTVGRVSKWLGVLEADAGLSGTSQRHVFGVLNTVLNHALKTGVIGHNPLASMPHRPTRDTDKTDREWWDVPTIKAFLSDPVVSQHRMFPFFMLAFDGGLRRGEFAGLKWGSIDFERGTVHVENSRVRASGGTVETAPKSRRGRPKTRTMSLSAPTLAALRKLKVSQQSFGGYVFTTEAGEPYSPESLSQLWERTRDSYIKRSGLSIPRPSLHEVRHSAISMWVAGGADLLSVAARSGHTDTGLIASTYGHVSPSQDRGIADGVASALEG